MAEKYSWNAADYHASSSSQEIWGRELISALKVSGKERILDLGCGDGKITAKISEAVPHGCVLGLDSSMEMIEYAKSAYPKKIYPNLAFVCGDMRTFDYTDTFDRVFSNAALHWVKEQDRVLYNIYRSLKPGGLMVIQMGGKGNAGDVFECIDRLLDSEPWKSYFVDFGFPYTFPDRDEYLSLLFKEGFMNCIVQMKNKDMTHNGLEGFSGWVRTTWMPYLNRLPPGLKPEFISAVYNEYIRSFPPDSRGNVHIAMVRLEVTAEKI